MVVLSFIVVSVGLRGSNFSDVPLVEVMGAGYPLQVGLPGSSRGKTLEIALQFGPRFVECMLVLCRWMGREEDEKLLERMERLGGLGERGGVKIFEKRGNLNE